MATKNGAVILPEWYQSLCELDTEVKYQVLDAICAYSLKDEELKLSNPIAQAVFKIYKPYIDEHKQNYAEKCENNKRNANKRWHNEECERIQTDANECERNEKEKEKKSKNKREIKEKENNIISADAQKKFNFKQALLDEGLSEDLVDEWLLIRRQKKAINSKGAYDVLVRECAKANITIAQAVIICCERQWKGFMAEYLQGLNSKGEKAPVFMNDEDFLRGVDMLQQTFGTRH